MVYLLKIGREVGRASEVLDEVFPGAAIVIVSFTKLFD